MTDENDHSARNRGPEEQEDQPSDFFAAMILKLGHFFSLLFLVSMCVLIFEVVMRYVFNSPTKWVHETTIFICAICFVFGGLHAVSRDGHIRIVLLYDHISDHMRCWFDVVIYSVCGAATAMFSYALWPTVVKSFYDPTGTFRMITSGSAWNPPFPALLRAFLFITLVAMTLQFAVLVINRARGKKRV